MIRPMSRRRPWKALLVLGASLLVTSCGDADEPTPSDATDRRSSAAESPATSPSDEIRIADESVDFQDALRPLRVAMSSRAAYDGPDGELILDVLEGDMVFATLLILDAEDRPVRGLRPTITPERDSRVVDAIGQPEFTDESGRFRFGLMGGTMGEERVEVAIGKPVGALLLNVISQRAAGYGWLDEIDGVLGWDVLLQADVEWSEQGLTATFTEEILARNAETVKLAGFLMPLEATRMQRHFVLTSDPPGCFFHVPGGPAGAVEVFTKEPLEVGWDPILLEGRFEAIEASEEGVVYRLHDARAVPLEPR